MKGKKAFLLAILLMALAVRASISFIKNQPAIWLSNGEFWHYFQDDPWQYVGMGMELLATGQLTPPEMYPTVRAPGYPFLLSIWFRIFGINSSVFFLGAILGTIIVYEIFVLSRTLFPDKEHFAWFSVVTATFWPNLTITVANPASDPLYLSLILIALINSIKLVRDTEGYTKYQITWRFAFIVMSLVGAVYVKPQGVLWLAIIVLAISLLTGYPKKLLHRFFLYPVISLIIFISLLSPWIYRNYNLTHRFIFVAENSVLFEHNNETYLDWSFFDKRLYGHSWPGEMSQNVKAEIRKCFLEIGKVEVEPPAGFSIYPCLNKIALRFIGEHPLAYAKLAFVRLAKLFSPTPVGIDISYSLALSLFWLLVYPLGIVSLWQYRRDRIIQMFIALPFMLELLLAMLIGTQLRHRLPIDILMLALSAAFIGRFIERHRFSFLERCIGDRIRRT